MFSNDISKSVGITKLALGASCLIAVGTWNAWETCRLLLKFLVPASHAWQAVRGSIFGRSVMTDLTALARTFFRFILKGTWNALEAACASITVCVVARWTIVAFLKRCFVGERAYTAWIALNHSNQFLRLSLSAFFAFETPIRILVPTCIAIRANSR
jgi:hypothetical protein